MLYVRKGLFGTGNIASAEEVNREFNRAADSMSEVDHMMVMDGAITHTNIAKPYESTRGISSTHSVTYATPTSPFSASLNRVSAVGLIPNAPVDFSDAGSGAWINVSDGAGETLALPVFLSDIAKVVVLATVQYLGGAGVTNPDTVDVSMNVMINGEPGLYCRYGADILGQYQLQTGLSVLDVFTLPAGSHSITARVRESVDATSKAAIPSSSGSITAITIAAVGLYR